MTKAALRKRWGDPAFLAALPIRPDREPTAKQLRSLDLRGVPHLGNGEPLWQFAIRAKTADTIDLSFGDGALTVNASQVHKLTAIEFRFDRASNFYQSTFSDCDFTRARLRLDMTDCTFVNGCFDGSTFAGGIQEHGLRRCTFENCSFKGAIWKNTYVLATRFIACEFKGMEFHNSSIAGFKHKACNPASEIKFVDCEVRSILDISNEGATPP